MSFLLDRINELDYLTSKLEDVDTLLHTVCENFFSKREPDPVDLKYNYKTFSDLTRLTENMLRDLQADYQKLSTKLVEDNKLIRALDGKQEVA